MSNKKTAFFVKKLNFKSFILNNSNIIRISHSMKILLTVLGLFFVGVSSATIYYIDPSGNDLTGNGTIANPWQNLHKATQIASAPGDIIHVNLGFYNESFTCNLAAGVSIEGEGTGSFIQSSVTGFLVPLLQCTSPEGTNGNQHISNLRIDGNNRTTSLGINFQGRSGVSVHDCLIENFNDCGTIISGQNGMYNGIPSVWATGCAFYNNTLNNNSGCGYDPYGNFYGKGNFMFGGTDGILIHDNVITQNQRAAQTNGWPIKGWYESHIKNTKIYSNILTTQAIPAGKVNGQDGFWDFAIEIFDSYGGNEIYNNTMTGSIDLNRQNVGTAAFSWKIYNNVIGFSNFPPARQSGIILEYHTESAIIENNIIRNVCDGIVFSARTGSHITNTVIQKNLLYNLGSITGYYGHGIGNFGSGVSGLIVSDFSVLNNTIVCVNNPAQASMIGVGIFSASVLSNIKVQNNVIQGFQETSLMFGSSNIITGSNFSHNNLYANAYNLPFTNWLGTIVLPTGNTIVNNISQNPQYASVPLYNLTTPGSPLIDAGTNVGLPYSGSAPDIGYYETGSASSNQLPHANAGPDQTITLPNNSTTFNGAGTDSDGIIIAYQWTKLTGPAGGNITNAAISSTSITGLLQGVYTYELKVTDNGGASGYDTIQITVNPDPNIAPIANAGPDQTITLPTNTVTLNGSGNDPDGSITAYLWTKIAGPATGTITSPSSATTNLSSLTQGSYRFELRVTDNSGAFGRDTVQITVNPDPNIAPIANAGPDQTITLPTNTVTLNGSGNDPDGSITAYLWTKIAGPATGTISTPNSAATSLTGLVQGTYRFELRVTDNSGAFGRDTVQIIVTPAPNLAPIANAGPDKTITLPVNTASLNGSGNDPDGSITAYLWTKIAGPAGTIVSPNSAATSLTGLVQGIYRFELRVTDNNGAFGRDTVQVTVNPDPNIAPSANAGSDLLITLPVNTVSLNGSGNDPDGFITAYLWTKIAGPASGTITAPSSASTNINGLSAGIYRFELRVTDNSGAYGRDTLQVIVNIAPVANAGNDISITLPVNSATLNGNASADADGNIALYTWTEISGPAAANITSPAAVSTSVTALTAGIYKFELKVTDNYGAVSRDTVQVAVFVLNRLPTANAGLNVSLTLPTNIVTLTGTGADADGTIVGYNWTKIAGPGAGSITTPASATTTVTGLNAGTYRFELRVTDNNGGAGRDTVDVIVNPKNLKPSAKGGGNKVVSVTNAQSVTLQGSGTDPDGTIVSYKWKQISGPADKLVSTNTSSTTLINLVEGIYKFELTVTDNHGETDADTVTVEVQPKAAVTALNTIKVYPNPVITSTILEINKDNNGLPMLISVADMQGKIVYQKKVSTSTPLVREYLDLSNVSKGIYIVTVYFNQYEKLTTRLTKQ
jgi:hypothetical protein